MATEGHKVQEREVESKTQCTQARLWTQNSLFEACSLYGFSGIINPSLLNPFIFKLEVTIAYPVKFLSQN